MKGKRSSRENSQRMREILAVLGRHEVTKGMTPEKLRLILEDLGPTYIKLGQIMSMRPDILPVAYCEELQKLRTNVEPMPSDEVRRVIECALHQPLEQVFPTFDFHPLGSASIAQAHRAKLADGQAVVVKVQREGIHEKMASDIALLKKAETMVKLSPIGETIDLGMVLDEMWEVSKEEMNFTIEAKNLAEFANLNKDIKYVTCPKVFTDYSSEHVLVMEEVIGFPVDHRDALTQAGYDLKEIATKLYVNYMKQILDDGFFHADPHPGNILIRDGKIVWLDLGMMGRISARDKRQFSKAISAVVSGKTDDIVSVILTVGKHSKPVNREVLRADCDQLLNEYLEMDLAEMDLGKIVQQVLELAKKHHIAMPPGVTMLSRGVLTIEGTVADLCPEINFMEILAARYTDTALENIDFKKLATENAKVLYKSGQKTLTLPALLSDLLKAAGSGELQFKLVQASDKQTQEQQAQHDQIVSRTAILCTGLVVSALLAFAPADVRWFGVSPLCLIGFSATGLYALLTRIFQKH